MPIRALRPCQYPGCPTLVSNEQRCELHQAMRQPTATRVSSHERGYGAIWRRLRVMQLQRHPLCADLFGEHQRLNEIVLATDVDHILPRESGGLDEASNLQSLCHSCHSRKTMLQTHFGKGRVDQISKY